jgi:protocatechuate 3,4-dioxygenase beta subunit
MLVVTPALGRRRFIVVGAATVGSLLVPRQGAAQQLVRTPGQTAGPFYPVQFPADVDNDLVVVRGTEARAAGVVTHVVGRVLGTDGAPLSNATVEIWQCDANGRYLHPADRGGKARDSAFQGYGRTTSAADGSYRFRTIRPVAYPGRTPHIHFAVKAPQGRELVTQMYVAGETLNAPDGVYAGIRDPRQREAVTVALAPADGVESGALIGAFDIVL